MIRWFYIVAIRIIWNFGAAIKTENTMCNVKRKHGNMGRKGEMRRKTRWRRGWRGRGRGMPSHDRVRATPAAHYPIRHKLRYEPSWWVHHRTCQSAKWVVIKAGAQTRNKPPDKQRIDPGLAPNRFSRSRWFSALWPACRRQELNISGSVECVPTS